MCLETTVYPAMCPGHLNDSTLGPECWQYLQQWWQRNYASFCQKFDLVSGEASSSRTILQSSYPLPAHIMLMLSLLVTWWQCCEQPSEGQTRGLV